MTFQDILGNFALILFILMIGTGVVWFLDVLYLKKQRRAKACLLYTSDAADE